MTRTFYPGAWYCDALPSGEYAVLYPHERVETHRGGIALPPGEPFGPRFVRVSNVGGFKFAGQADAVSNGAWEWIEGSGWRVVGGLCVGTSPVIYDFAGTLHCSDGSIGSQGYRYVAPDSTPAGYLVTGDATYRRELAPGLSLYEWSAVGPLLIGQGQDGGVWAWDGLVLRLIEAGDGRFVRVQYDGDRVSIAFMKSAGAVVMQTTIAELLALPPQPKPTPGPLPAPQPQPTPEPVQMPTAPNVLSQIRAVFAAHPEIDTREEVTRGRITDYVVLALGGVPWGRKDRDQNPSNNNNSDDALCYRLADQRFEIYDIINGGDGSPAFDYKGTFADGENGYFREVPGAPTPGPTPQPQPQPTPTIDLGPVLAMLQEIEERLDRLESRKVALKTHDGHYLCAEQGGGGTVNATRQSPGAWETFTVEPQ